MSKHMIIFFLWNQQALISDHILGHYTTPTSQLRVLAKRQKLKVPLSDDSCTFLVP